MPTSVIRNNQVWDVVVSRKAQDSLIPVWLCHFDRETRKTSRMLLCQVQNNHRFGWTVVVAGSVSGPRLVEGFKHRWQAVKYALAIIIAS